MYYVVLCCTMLYFVWFFCLVANQSTHTQIQRRARVCGLSVFNYGPYCLSLHFALTTIPSSCCILFFSSSNTSSSNTSSSSSSSSKCRDVAKIRNPPKKEKEKKEKKTK